VLVIKEAVKAVFKGTLWAKDAPSECIYLFSEGSRPLYVGRTRHLRQRLRQQSIPGAQHNQAVFAFRLAREKTGSHDRKILLLARPTGHRTGQGSGTQAVACVQLGPG
jgi:hypothetical protein